MEFSKSHFGDKKNISPPHYSVPMIPNIFNKHIENITSSMQLETFRFYKF